MIATVRSAVLVGVDGVPVSVEVHASNGLPGFTIVGLPDAAVRESRDRVRAALLSSDLPWPLRRVTVNLAPSGMRKCGAGLDLPIAVGVLVAVGVLTPEQVDGMAFVGELGLDGSVRSVPGALVLAESLRAHEVVVPPACACEVALSDTVRARTAPTLRALVTCLEGHRPWLPVEPSSGSEPPPTGSARPGDRGDLADVRGQRWGRRALEVAAAGGHHLLFVGPPGSGKTMLAQRFCGLLPDLPWSAAMEVARVRSAAGLPLPPGQLLRRPPFRAPHHGASPVSVIGGGTWGMRPGEVSLASGGALFLDEMGEFPSSVLEALRQPLEEGEVRVSRARAAAVFPARFVLIGAMNPCPCGDGGAPGECRCSDVDRRRYARRLSAPLLDRFDIAIRLDRPRVEDLVSAVPGEPTAAVAARVAVVRRLAAERGVAANAQLPAGRFDEVAPLTAAALELVAARLRSGDLSARGLHRVRRLARTIADLDGAGRQVDVAHVREALLLRCRRSLLLGEGG